MPKRESDAKGSAGTPWPLDSDPALGWGWGWGDHGQGDWDRPRRQGAPGEPPSVEQQLFRHVMGHFVTGVTVITAMVEDRPLGMTAQSFVSLSLDPPLVMFSPARHSYTWQQIEDEGVLCINVLSRKQEDLSRRFASKTGERFDGVSWKGAPVTGSPLLEGVHAWVDCELEQVHAGGDHLIVVCRVLALAAPDDSGDPLVFHLGKYGEVTRATE
jgi:3-hydroxy-9,10-secoandrosta-1,3,5(10)-triene-9,17-dione monooxygenase reductase component